MMDALNSRTELCELTEPTDPYQIGSSYDFGLFRGTETHQ